MCTLTSRALRACWLAVGLAASLASGSAHAQEINFGNVSSYGLLVFEDLRGSVKADGRIAVGGAARITSGSAGLALTEQGNLPVVVVRGGIDSWMQGTLANAGQPGFGVFVGVKAGPESVSPALDLRQTEAPPLDFDGDRMNLGVLSEQLRDLVPTGTVTQGQGVLTLTGAGVAGGREVFSLTAAQAASQAMLVLVNVAPDAQVVVNVRSDAMRLLSLGLDTTALEPWKGRVLFNSRDAEQIQLNGQTLWGALLAPDSCVCTRSTGRVEGAVVVRSWDTDMSLGWVPFVTTN